MKDFEELTNRGRARRLRRLALSALADYDLPIARFRLVTNSFNGIFRLDTAMGEKYIVRVCLPEERFLVEIQSEMAWLAALRRDTDLAVPEPVPTRTGALVTTATAPGYCSAICDPAWLHTLLKVRGLAPACRRPSRPCLPGCRCG